MIVGGSWSCECAHYGRANPSTEVVDDTKTASVSQPYAQHRPPQAIVCFLNKFEFYC